MHLAPGAGTRYQTAAFAMVVAVTAMTATSAAAPAPDPYAGCRRVLADRPDDYDSAYCFYETTASQGLWDVAPAVLESLIAEQPGNFWLPLMLGYVVRSRDATRAEALYRQAADGFHDAGHLEGEVLARIGLRDMLFPLGRAADAAREVDAVVALAARTADPLVRARVWITQASQLQDAGGDLGVAYRLLKQAEAAVVPNGPYRLTRTLLSTQASVAFRLGRWDEALATYGQIDALAAASGDVRLRASAQYNLANTTATKEMLAPSEGGRARLVSLTERALGTAIAAHNDDLVARSHRALAELLAAEPGSGLVARDHAQQCLSLAAKLRLAHDEAVCSWVLASLIGVADPAARAAAERRALAATARANNPRTEAFSAGRRMRLSWETKPREPALHDAFAAIDAIERLRRLQEGAGSTAELFSAWTQDYYWLSGRLLEQGDEAGVERAFAVTERMRGRALLESLSARTLRTGDGIPRAKAAVLDEISAVQRRLTNPALDAVERRRSLAELESLERRAQEGDGQRAGGDGRIPLDPAFADLATVQASLDENEALLTFQVGLWETFDRQFGGGSWLVMLTRRDRAVFRLPDRSALAPLVPVFTGLLSRDDGLDQAAAVRLYDVLLAPALSRLPASVTRLVLVPDAMLHALPFDALRAARGAPPLAARYQLVVAPSATLWRHWRTRAVPGPRRALAFADPTLGVPGEGVATERNATLQRGLRLGRLPYARRETRAMARHVGEVDVLVGDEASERALKAQDLAGFGLLHFAAHAVADDTRPDRAAVLLAPGDAREDGLLQAREIEGLDLGGRVIVLSACRSADGVVQSGEGVLSLARAFFAAGAQAVIGSRWPIRDEDAAAFFDDFYRHVGEGTTLAEAVARAKTDAIADGRPASAWAGVVLYGDGQSRLLAGGRRPRVVQPVLIGLLVAVGAALCVAVLRRLRRHAQAV